MFTRGDIPHYPASARMAGHPTGLFQHSYATRETSGKTARISGRLPPTVRVSITNRPPDECQEKHRAIAHGHTIGYKFERLFPNIAALMSISPATLWLTLALVLAGLEMFSGTFYLLALAIGLASGALAAWINLPFPVQTSIVAIVSVIAAILLRR